MKKLFFLLFVLFLLCGSPRKATAQTNFWTDNGSHISTVAPNLINVGIGISIPVKSLHIVTSHGGDASTHEGIRLTDHVTPLTTTFTSTWDLTPEVDLSNGNLIRFDIGTPGNPMFSIRDNGDVGIGNTVPLSRLDINGDILISGSRLHVNSAGNVGIGVTNLVNRLEVAGTAVIGSNLAGNGVLAPPEGLRVQGTILIGQTGDETGTTRLHTLGAIRTDATRTFINGFNGGKNHFISTTNEATGKFIMLNGEPNGVANFVNIAPGGGDGLTVDNAKNVAMGTTFTDPTLRLLVIGNGKFTGELRVNGNGRIDDTLTVCGEIFTTRVVVESPTCDFVFDKDYKRLSVEEKSKYHLTYKHLRGVQSKAEVDSDGFDVGRNLSGVIMNVEENALDISDLYSMYKELHRKYAALESRYEDVQHELTILKGE